MLRGAADKAFGMTLEGDIKDGLPLRDEFGRLAIVDCGGRQQV